MATTMVLSLHSAVDPLPPPTGGPPYSAIVWVLRVAVGLVWLAFIVLGITAAIERFQGTAGPEALQRMGAAFVGCLIISAALAIVQAIV
jgi:hypothetical protein